MNNRNPDNPWPYYTNGWDQPTVVNPGLNMYHYHNDLTQERLVDPAVWDAPVNNPEPENPTPTTHPFDTFLRRALMSGLVLLVWFLVGIAVVVMFGVVSPVPAPYEGHLLPTVGGR
jgi:hypothetical protein